MNADAIRERLRRQPFQPFEVHLTNGEVHMVRHPEWVIVLPSRIVIGFPDDRMVICGLIHIATIHLLQPAA